MNDQLASLRLIPGVDPDELITEVKAQFQPIATICLFSGGSDSTVLAHRCREHYDAMAFIDTGTAVPGVREFVQEYAKWIDRPLHVLEAGEKYRNMVLGLNGLRPLGFPGPAQHNRAYNQLKERQLRVLRKELKEGQPRNSRVLFITGIRKSESKRRQSRQHVTHEGSIVFANPLCDWTSLDMRAYRERHDLPQSDVVALLHRSGECQCGSFATEGEREMLRALWPDWFEQTIASLEREAQELGLPACKWGSRSGAPVETGPLCSDCQLRMEVA